METTMSKKPTKQCDKCDRNITVNNFDRHMDACVGPIKKKIRGVDFDPNHGFKTGERTAWNKGMKIGPNVAFSEHYAILRKNRDTSDFKSRASIRLKVLEEQNFKCNRCGNDSWLNQPLTLELEHKDGIRTNNIRENLECLCPNCHSQTTTWRGRDRKKKYGSLV